MKEDRSLPVRGAILVVCIFQLWGCQTKKVDPTETIARVGEAYLTRETVISLIPTHLGQDEQRVLIKNLVDKWIERQVLAQTARDEGVELSPHESWQIEKVELEMYATKLITEKVPKDFAVTDKEIEDFYNANQSQFERQRDEVHIVHLYLEKLDRALVTEIQQSQSLTEVIQKNFLDRQQSRVVEPNGDLGYVEVDKLHSQFRSAIRGTKTGIIYGPIRTDEGYHFLQVLDRKPANSIRSLDLVRSEIIDVIKIEKRHAAIKRYVENLKKNYEVETFLDGLE